MQKPDICIYHGFCPDGFTSAWAIWKRFGDDVEYRHGSYGSPPPSNVTGKHVLLIDFSYKADVLREMAKTAASITILDHHKTAEADLKPLFDEGLITGVFDMDKSGARLAWEWAHPEEPVPYLVQYVEDRDLWRWKFGSVTERFCAHLDIWEQTFENWSLIDEGSRDPKSATMALYLERGECLRQRHLKNCKSMIAATLHHVKIGRFRVPCCNVPHMYCSDVGNILARREDAPFSATFFVNKEGWTVWSLRSIDGKQDVSEIADAFNGGGHRNAAGFRLEPGEVFERVD